MSIDRISNETARHYTLGPWPASAVQQEIALRRSARLLSPMARTSAPWSESDTL